MGKDSSEIRREIEQTRARLGDTVEALSYKADVPSRVKDAVNERVDTVRGTIGDVVESVKGTVADAAGALGGAVVEATSKLDSATGKLGTALGGASRTMSRTLNATTDKLGDATSTVSSNMTNLTSSVNNLAGSVSGTVGSVAQKLPDPSGVTNAARRGVSIATENPLGLAIGALAVGFLAGLATPVSDLEREKVGPLRDELLERAKTVGTDALEHGKQVLQETAQAAIGAAQQAAQQHGQQVLSEVTGDGAQGENQGQRQTNTQGGGQSRGGSGSTQYGVLLDDQQQKNTLDPGAPGTASP